MALKPVLDLMQQQVEIHLVPLVIFTPATEIYRIFTPFPDLFNAIFFFFTEQCDDDDTPVCSNPQLSSLNMST